MLAKCISGCSMLPIMCIFHQKIREKSPISKSRQPDGGISHLEHENLLLHIVGGGGLSWKIQPCVEDFFLAYLLVVIEEGWFFTVFSPMYCPGLHQLINIAC